MTRTDCSLVIVTEQHECSGDDLCMNLENELGVERLKRQYPSLKYSHLWLSLSALKVLHGLYDSLKTAKSGSVAPLVQSCNVEY
jgi:hypothetical protein